MLLPPDPPAAPTPGDWENRKHRSLLPAHQVPCLKHVAAVAAVQMEQENRHLRIELAIRSLHSSHSWSWPWTKNWQSTQSLKKVQARLSLSQICPLWPTITINHTAKQLSRILLLQNNIIPKMEGHFEADGNSWWPGDRICGWRYLKW